ncbi:histidinol-phosphate aminotransferase [Sphaerisporangium melleum]|uniref:Histidinol-phosphate aminotransferase n=1 Tax=Sphaerisporangium melleum TaxID=321316 RepID=A0A917RIW6_9ACTN|nr:histidinol-phosphate transaminase [Sphaerisporangium melleum]GGL10004.1 histidinol-phosphate aminotransferase [Sphaerisporangium melleum]GII70788.1 histidinol-phosphate aminotransferase [Sphaerisporangium melleum]
MTAGRMRLSDLPIRNDLRGRSPYGAPQIDAPVLLNTNENPYPPSEGLVADLAEAVRRDAATLNRYPDREVVALREDLADYLGHGLTAERVWAANGSNEVLQQILQAFGGPGRSAMGFEPSYSMHPIITTGAATRWISGAREDDFGLDPGKAVAAIEEHRPDIVFLTSPNNPTGTALPLEAIQWVVEAAPGMVVVDEAYFEFARTGTPSALTLLEDNPRLIVTRTMSKAFAMAGTRLGYLAADPAVIEALLLVRLPYHLSTLTQAAARVAVAHRGELLGTVDRLRAERDACVARLRGQGLSVADSDANFVLFGRFGDRRAVWEGLLEHGVLIREVGPPEWLRVSIGTADEMATFHQALTAVLPTADVIPAPGRPGRDDPQQPEEIA